MAALQSSTSFYVAFLYLFQGVGQLLDNLDQVWAIFPPLVRTKYGLIQGTIHRARGGLLGPQFFFFRGIPYAEPPLGNLRYEAPQYPRPWSGVYDGQYYRQPCLQIFYALPEQVPFGSEDCLHLNVATRKAHTSMNPPTNGLRPVLVFIHGGAFMMGGSNIFPPVYLLQDDLVYVLINYRLNSFGFLSSGDGVIQGNFGLKDQTMALKWVQDNIRWFNGDPKRVVIFGESAGSVCTHLHTLSPLSDGLFSGAISMSGTALSPWVLQRNPAIQAREFASGVGCPTDDTKAMLYCLKQKPADDLVKFHVKFMMKYIDGQVSMFGPTVESSPGNQHPAFLPDDPLTLLQKGRFSDKPWMNGVNSGDGLILVLPIMLDEKLTKLLNDKWELYAPLLMFYQNHSNEQAISSQIRSQYLQNKPISKNNIAEFGMMLSDRCFFTDSHKAALLQSKRADVYLYYYNYAGIFALAGLIFESDSIIGAIINWVYANIFQIPPENKFGISHGDELPLIFNMPVVRKKITMFDADYGMSRKLVQLLGSFAELGRPHPPSAGLSMNWPTVRQSNPTLDDDKALKRFQIQNDGFYIAYEPFFQRLKFWKDIDLYP